MGNPRAKSAQWRAGWLLCNAYRKRFGKNFRILTVFRERLNWQKGSIDQHCILPGLPRIPPASAPLVNHSAFQSPV